MQALFALDIYPKALVFALYQPPRDPDPVVANRNP
jgi:hypothetical protein